MHSYIQSIAAAIAWFLGTDESKRFKFEIFLPLVVTENWPLDSLDSINEQLRDYSGYQSLLLFDNLDERASAVQVVSNLRHFDTEAECLLVALNILFGWLSYGSRDLVWVWESEDGTAFQETTLSRTTSFGAAQNSPLDSAADRTLLYHFSDVCVAQELPRFVNAIPYFTESPYLIERRSHEAESDVVFKIPLNSTVSERESAIFALAEATFSAHYSCSHQLTPLTLVVIVLGAVGFIASFLVLWFQVTDDIPEPVIDGLLLNHEWN